MEWRLAGKRGRGRAAGAAETDHMILCGILCFISPFVFRGRIRVVAFACPSWCVLEVSLVPFSKKALDSAKHLRKPYEKHKKQTLELKMV